MILDILVAILAVLALFKGYQRGLIVGFFSLIAVIIGLAAALKLSAVVAVQLGKTVSLPAQWLPLISFVLVFIGVILLVRLGANAIQKVVELSMLGWVNRIGGMLLYLLLYAVVISILFFYLAQMGVLSASATRQSLTYPYLQPWGPRVINAIGSVIPFFANMFEELQQFFAGVSTRVGA